MNQSFDLSIIVACYNDGEYLEHSLCEIERVMDQTRYSYELILIDDCSTDGSAMVVQESAAKRSKIQMAFHEMNVGRGGTVSEGMRMARGRFVGFLDIDLEVHARYIPSMIQALEDGYDGATACRYYEIRCRLDIFCRHILSKGYHSLVRLLLLLPYYDTETGYKFFRRNKILPVLEKIHCPGWFWDTEIMAQCHYHGLRVKEIPALFLRRPERTTSVRLLRDSFDYLRELIRFLRKIKNERSTKEL